MTQMYRAIVTAIFPVEVEAESHAEATRIIDGVIDNASGVAVVEAMSGDDIAEECMDASAIDVIHSGSSTQLKITRTRVERS